MKRRNVKIGLAALAGVVIAGAIFGFRTYRDKLTVSLQTIRRSEKPYGLSRAGPRSRGNASIMPTRALRPLTFPMNGSLRWNSHVFH